MILEGIIEAFRLLFTFNKEIYEIIFLSLALSLLSTIIASVIGVVSGIAISTNSFVGKKLLKKLIFTFMGIPPVVMGLFVLLMLIGPFDDLNLLFTFGAMLIAQTLLVIPIITGNIIISSEKTQKEVLETATTLGANKKDKMYSVFSGE